MRGSPGEEDAIPATIDGRPVISRADMQAMHGVSVKSAYLWYRDRAATGHPEPAGTIGRTTYWFEDEWLAWRESWRDRKLRGLTQVDRRGDPDDLVDAAEAARIMGYSDRNVIHGNLQLGYFPSPDDYGKTARGRPSPRWRRSTVWAAADGRKGRGAGGRLGRRARRRSRTHTRVTSDWMPSCGCCVRVPSHQRRRWLRNGRSACGRRSGSCGWPGASFGLAEERVSDARWAGPFCRNGG
jgi:hypothetical protein